ncbi:GAP family protein [Streptacidiphilus sp. P02-A3a]|uniref:GAP family protein n=1 Tax=Streptacidiphilus sp. P02-A3a TaxID=2704468 RepID=UPI0015F9C4D0|nr:GAP family protein [Streptacidiphilus sp. P02-A3a]QMU69123.1 GAP family protein [Streptacidiphilus sp. P02-A3a]
MVLDLLLIGLVITLYPLPVMAFVLVLSAPGGVRKGLAFILAWLACLVAVIAGVLLFTGGQPPAPRSPSSTAALLAKLALGLGLVLYGERRRRLRSTSGPPGPVPAPSRMDQVTWRSAAGFAVLLQPWGMVAAAAATVVEADLSHGASYLALMGFCVLATASLLAMELYAVFAPEQALRVLTGLRSWMSGHQDQAVVVACLFLGFWVASRALIELTG